MWTTWFWMSVASVVLAVSISYFIDKASFITEFKYNLLKWLLGGVFVAVCCLHVPLNVPQEGATFWSWVEGIVMSLFDSFDVFKGGCNYTLIVGSMSASLGNSVWYKVWVLLLFVAAPVFTVGVIATFFMNVSAYLRYIAHPFKAVYAFSDINAKSLALATDIRKNHKKAMIVFTDCMNDNDGKGKELLKVAKSLGAVCFKSNMTVVNLKLHSVGAPIYLFVIGKDDSANTNLSIKVVGKYRNRKNTNVYVFSTSAESELMLTSVDKGEIRLRRINESRSLINRILYEQGQQIFENAIESEAGVRNISAVIVGMGLRGTEMLKALSWFCQMDGYSVKINAFDKDELAEKKFAALAPDLLSPKYNRNRVKGEAQYDICIHSDIDVESKTFADEIAKINDATYVFISLGSDDLNIKTAVNLRMYFERMGIHPVIQAVVANFRKSEALRDIKNYKKQGYDIAFLGDVKTSFTEAVILDSDLEDAALAVHMKWGKEEEFWTYEYNYQSSTASAIHMKARIACGIPGADKNEEDLTVEERDIIEELEHRRWNAYMRAEGYIYAEKRNDMAKTHNNLVEFEALPDVIKRIDSRVGTK